MDERLMTWPAFRAVMCGSTAAMPWRTPRMFTSIMRFHSSILSSASGESGITPRVIDDRVDPAEFFQREFGEALHVCEIRDVERAMLMGLDAFMWRESV